MTNKRSHQLIFLFLVVLVITLAIQPAAAQSNNDWYRRQQQQQQMQQQRQLEQQRQQQRQQQQQQMRDQMRQQMQQQMRQQMQQQMQQQMRQQQRNQLAGTSLKNTRSATVVSTKNDRVLYSNGVAKLTRPLTPSEIRRGFTGKLTPDGRALVKVNGRVLAVPAARVGIKLNNNLRSAQSSQWTASKRASISAEIQRLANVKLTLKSTGRGNGGRPPSGGGNGGGGGEPPKRVAANDNNVKILGRGSTGRTEPRNLKEKLAMDQAMSNPTAGIVLRLKEPMRNPKWPAKEGWVKMAQNINGVEIHYVRNKNTGEVDDFKFKN